jgi:hypothetical protein
MGLSVGFPQTCNLEPVFQEFTTDLEMPGDLKRGLTFEYKSAQCRKGNQRVRSGGVGCLFVDLSIFSRDGSAVFVFGNHFQTAGLMSEKNVRYLLHQRGIRSHAPVVWIEYDDSATVGQWARTGTTGPTLGSRAKQMFASFRTKSLDLIKTNNQQVRKLRQLKRVECATRWDSGEVAKAHSAQLEFPPLLPGR